MNTNTTRNCTILPLLKAAYYRTEFWNFYVRYIVFGSYRLAISPGRLLCFCGIVHFLKIDDRTITSHMPQTFLNVSPSVRIIQILRILDCDKTSTFLDCTLLGRNLIAEVLQNNKGKGKFHLSTGLQLRLHPPPPKSSSRRSFKFNTLQAHYLHSNNFRRWYNILKQIKWRLCHFFRWF